MLQNLIYVLQNFVRWVAQLVFVKCEITGCALLGCLCR